MNMLWKNYVFRRGDGVHDMWEEMYNGKDANFLYITGKGFDVRAVGVLGEFIENIKSSGCDVQSAELLLIDFTGYELSDQLLQKTEENARLLINLFEDIGNIETISIKTSLADSEEISPSNALKQGLESILSRINSQSDIILDISSLPRVIYLSIMMGILHKLIPDKKAKNPLSSNKVSFQILVGEDVNLDNKIVSEEPSNKLILIPGYSSILQAESYDDWSLVWFPILGENKVNQLDKIIELASIPEDAEICPVLPHPSVNPRRADQLLIEYNTSLFNSRKVPTSNILFAHENHPFEAYRQLLSSMQRYLKSIKIIGGCRLVVTPLASKLITIAAGLACFEIRTESMVEDKYGVAIPYAEPTRYSVSLSDLSDSKPEISSLLLTGDAYSQ